MNESIRAPHRLLRHRIVAPLAVAGFALTAFAASPAQAAPPQERGERDRQGMCERLKCTDDQREEMKQIRRELHATLTPEQRKQLAKVMAKRGPKGFMKGGKDKKWQC